MKILHVISTMAPRSGGPTRVLAELARAQSRVGHDVTICTTDRGNPVSERLSRASIQERIGSATLQCFPVEFAPLLVSRKMSTWLRSTVRQFDVVDVHGLYRFPPTFAAYCARHNGIPYVIRPHGALDQFLYPHSSKSVLLKRLYERWFDLPNLRLAAGLHFTTEEEGLRASYLGLSTPSFVVPNGIDRDRFLSLPRPGAFRQRLGLSDVPLLLFLGRINFKKGLDLLVDAFARVVQAIPEAHLVIAGPDNEGYGRKVHAWVQQYHLEARTHFIDFLSPVDAVQAYVDADVFVLPSYTENFGLSVVEAMACGTPVVISDQVNIHREVAVAAAGLVTPCDASAIAGAICELLAESAKADAMGENGRASALSGYSWQAVESALAHEYDRAIARTTAGAAAARGSDRIDSHASSR